MKILLLHFLSTENEKDKEIIKKLEKAVISKGDIIESKSAILESDNVHFALYDYVAVLIKPNSIISAKLPQSISDFISSHMGLEGRKGCALVVKSGLRSEKVCHNVMTLLEKEGMVLDYFNVIENIDHACSVGKNIG